MERIYQKGFTIVELLIVIVVIGILAAITIVAFNGIQNRANNTAIQSDLKNIGKLLDVHYTLNDGTYPSSLTLLSDIKVSKSSYGDGYWNGSGFYNLLYCYAPSGVDATYAIVATSKSGVTYQYNPKDGGLKEHGYNLATAGTTCPRAGVATTLTGYNVRWIYAGGSWTI